MKLPLSWLQEYVTVKEKPPRVAEIFTALGFEVEKIESFGSDWEKVVVAKIVSIRPHPNATRLRLATVTDGQTAQEVVCGAPNIAVGQRVPYAREGVTLPSGQKIARLSIRGVESRGMLCSAKELGFGLDHAGILILPATATVGATLTQTLDFHDVVFDLTIPPSRPDCLSVMGLAREYAAATGRRCLPKKRATANATAPARGLPSVRLQIADKTLCPLYTARLITGVTVAESPLWLKKRLLAAGLRPINNVVDATNYIMLETGQPLHAFDVDKLETKKGGLTISVRLAADGEQIITLDGTKRSLDKNTLVIADARQPIAVAGVMGGQASEVGPETHRLLLEAAVFQPRAVRRSSQILGLRSESSTRFEKGLSLAGTAAASSDATRLIVSLAGGKAAAKSVGTGVGQQKRKTVIISPEELNRLLGQKLTLSQIKAYLTRLGCRVEGTMRRLRVTPPDWRSDIVYAADIVEEVGRLSGYNTVEPTLPTGLLRPVRQSVANDRLENIRDVMVRLGYAEVYTYSFYGRGQAASTEVPAAEHYQIANPLNPDQQYLRTSLWPGLKDVLRKNAAAIKNASIFEIGRVFLPGTDRPVEKTQLGAVIVRKRTTAEKLFQECKGVLEQLWSDEKNQALQFKGEGAKYNIMLPNNTRLGFIAIVPEAVAHECKIDGLIGYLNLDMESLPAGSERGRYQAFSHYPAIERDLAIVVPEAITFEQVRKIISQQNEPTIMRTEPAGLIRKVELFSEIYRGSELGAGKKSLPIRLVFQSDQRTLRREEVDIILKTIIDTLVKQLQASVRGASAGNKE
ncbi:MAG: phenylalanine--tRNA ligase subunit beta [Patescibacteria group bacterium]